jgi:hypothetical protein
VTIGGAAASTADAAAATTAAALGDTNNVGTSPDTTAAGESESACPPDVVVTETASPTQDAVTVDRTATVVPFPAGNGTDVSGSTGAARPTAAAVKARFFGH